MQKISSLIFTLMLLAILPGCFGNSAQDELTRRLFTGQTTPAGSGYSILFVSNRSGSLQVYKMNRDGSNQTQLTTEGDNSSPSFTPDGRILFRSSRDGNSEIYLMNADGSSQTRITDNPAYDGYPMASPDGQTILFQSDRENNTMNVFSMNYQGENALNLSNHQDSWNGLASVNPAGNLISFTSDEAGDYEIFLMGADGSNQVSITPHEENNYDDTSSYFSPDGNKIVFVSNRDPHSEIYLMNLDGSSQTRLTGNGADNDFCRFLPDGRILFASNINQVWQVFVMNQDGSGLAPLTTPEQADSYPYY